MNNWLDDIPWCGTPPAPAELWMRWNLDPVLLGVLLVLMIWHAHRTGFLHRSDERRATARLCFIGGWGALTLGLISPICALSVALFSARIAQHMWLVLIAAPLLTLAGPVSLAPRATIVPKAQYSLFSGGTAFAVCLWLWHAPLLYALTFTSDLAYWTMHVTLIGSALILWRSMLGGNGLGRVGVIFFTFLQMGLLGALITLAPRILYGPHVLTASLWGFSPLRDQQLGGLIMWIPAGFVLLFVALASVLVLLRPAAAEHSTAP